MIHIGVDSIKLTRNEIQVLVEPVQAVKAGETIARLDLDAFQKQGIDDTIIAILLNSSAYQQITADSTAQVLIAE